MEKINNRISHIQDEYIEWHLAADKSGERKLNLTTMQDAEKAYSSADFVIIAAPTNYDSSTQQFDTSAVEAVIELVMEYNPDAIMVIKSTIPVVYTESIRKRPGVRIFYSARNSYRNPKSCTITLPYPYHRWHRCGG